MTSATTERGLMMVFSNPASAAQEKAFNDWYDDVHLREVLQVPGVVAASRYRYGEEQMLPGANPLGTDYLAIYEIEAESLQQVRGAMMATSAERSHSEALQLDPLPVMMIFRQLGDRITG